MLILTTDLFKKEKSLYTDNKVVYFVFADGSLRTNTKPASLESSLNEATQEFRERTNSDPLSKKPSLKKKTLSRMTSLPVSPESDVPPNLDPQRSQAPGTGNQGLKQAAPPVIVVEEEQEGAADGDRSDSLSMSSRGSSMYAGPQNLLYTDSEDNRSVSNRSSNMGDSGFC